MSKNAPKGAMFPYEIDELLSDFVALLFPFLIFAVVFVSLSAFSTKTDRTSIRDDTGALPLPAGIL